MKHSKNILVLGAEGMTGRIVYSYFKSKKNFCTYGTVKKRGHNSNFFTLNAETAARDLKVIQQKIKRINVMINCTGILLNNSPLAELIEVNSLFPHKLEKLSDELNCLFFHISTDAVFSKNAGSIYENQSPSPQDYYGASKFLGETISRNSLTIRTSLIGFSPEKKHGILEWILSQKGEVSGFYNQAWSGCTTLQFAKFCEHLLNDDTFYSLRQKTPVIHFSPLATHTKYSLLHATAKIFKIKVKIKKSRSQSTISRRLRSHFTDFYNDLARETLEQSLQHLKDYEKKHPVN